MIRPWVSFACLLSVAPALAGSDGGPSNAKFDLALPTFEALPTQTDLTRPTPNPPPKADGSRGAPRYAVTRVQHAKAFTPSPSGASPKGGQALEAIALEGVPPTSERFVSVIRVKCGERLAAPIEVLISDPRGELAMSATGTLNYRGKAQDEAEFTVEWEPTALRGPGDFQVTVKIANEAMGQWPLKFRAQ